VQADQLPVVGRPHPQEDPVGVGPGHVLDRLPGRLQVAPCQGRVGDLGNPLEGRGPTALGSTPMFVIPASRTSSSM
jgi:hypothetical protein